MVKSVAQLALFFLLITVITSISLAASVKHQPYCRCEPQQACWPSEKDWAALAKQLTGKLIKPTSLITDCQADATSDACKTALKNIHNPFFNEANPAGLQSQGWFGAWKNQLSTYVVEAENTQDIVTAVNFARQHKIKIAIKGTGHDYLGRSNAANSLLIWTHNMRHVQIDKNFIPQGCPNTIKGVSALTIGAGTRWLEAYGEATTKHQLYVQGGGCTSVGAAGGFTQGGGFGSFSKRFGTGAAGILQVEIVTANGDVLVANRCQHADLFWAIRGGGAGTYGVVTKMTLKTHVLPNNFGLIKGSIKASDDMAYKKLVRQFLIFYRDKLNNAHWGEQFSFDAKNTINIYLVFADLTKEQVQALWKPFNEWVDKHSNQYKMQTTIITLPARHMWDAEYMQKNHPDFVTFNNVPNASKGEFWWTSNSNEFSMYWYTYQSWWLPLRLFEDKNISKLTDVFFNASRLAPVTLHINKGLAGGSREALQQSKETATNPSALTAAALVIMGEGSNQVYLGVPGKEPDKQKAKQAVQKITQAMQYFMQAAPHAGAYVNEADYFQKNWQQAFWGDHYAKLVAIKNKYDPDGVFYCHHCVGSERWNDNGMCLKRN